jgi:hypothetical protein
LVCSIPSEASTSWKAFSTSPASENRRAKHKDINLNHASALAPHSMGSWIRIRTANAFPDPDPEGGKTSPEKDKILSLKIRKI